MQVREQSKKKRARGQKVIVVRERNQELIETDLGRALCEGKKQNKLEAHIREQYLGRGHKMKMNKKINQSVNARSPSSRTQSTSSLLVSRLLIRLLVWIVLSGVRRRALA